MPDTAILKSSAGWYDRDNPNTTFRVRREARAARRAARGGPVTTPSAPKASMPSQTITYGTVTQLNNGHTTTTMTGSLSSLQMRLYDRLTMNQGVSNADALEVITNNGYNKAASYGHMRAAGANHYEALAVIDLDSPSVSKAYGVNRADGMNHTDALAEALKDDDGT